MLSWKFLMAALALETAALLSLFQGDHGALGMARFFLLHGGASIFLALFVKLFLPRRYRHPRWMALVLMAGFSFFIPVLGLLGLWLAIVAAVWFPRREKSLHFTNVHLPEFVPRRPYREDSIGHVAIKPLLGNRGIPAERRMNALLALEGVAPREAAKTLRETLDDTVDDIRLVAYGILDRREKVIQAKIHQKTIRLQQRLGDESHLLNLRQLAELNWEMVYENLAQGDVRHHFIETALGYAEQALSHAPEDTGLWFMKGRLWLELNDLAQAEMAFYTAAAHGMPKARNLPFLAEIAYRRQQYEQVGYLLGELAHNPVNPRTKPLVEYWTVPA